MGVLDTSFEVVGDDLVDIEFVASGGSGTVYRAVQRSLDRVVALKVLHGVDLRDDQTQREARVQAKVSAHANVVTLYGTTTVNGSSSALIMEFVPGGSLADRIERSGRLDLDEWLRAGREVSSALAAAHELGIVHRDVKPSNVLFAADGSARLGDFGISDTGTRTIDQLEASVAFAAPEILEGDRPSAANDLFSLALTLLVAAVGRHPFGEGVPVAAMAARIQSERIRFTDWVPDLPAELGNILDRCLDLEPEERPSAAELSLALTPPAGSVGADSSPERMVSEVLGVRAIELVDDRYGFEQKLLDSVSFKVRSGEVLALVGRSDSGSRLALEVAGGVRSFASGSVCVRGEQVTPKGRRRYGWAFVAPDPQVFPTLTVKANLAFFAGLGAGRREAIRRRAESVADTMLLREFMNLRASDLSPLCAYRLHLAIAMVSDPAVVIIDGIDLRSGSELGAELVRAVDVMIENQLGVVVGTDDVHLAGRLASRFAVMDKGRVVAQGTSDSLLTAYVQREAVVTLDRESARSLMASGREVHTLTHVDSERVRLTLPLEEGATINSLLDSMPAEVRRRVTSVEVQTPSLESLLSRLMASGQTPAPAQLNGEASI